MGLVKVEPGSTTERYLTSSDDEIELVSVRVEGEVATSAGCGLSCADRRRAGPRAIRFMSRRYRG